MNKLNYDKKTVSFDSIFVGGMFEYNQKTYMKIQSSFSMIENNCCYDFKYGNDEYYDALYLAVNLGNGEVDSFKWNAEVDVVKIDRIEIKTDT